MDSVLDLFLGDPVYDERGQLVRREFGLKNALALLVLGYIAYTLYCSMGKKVFSGKRKGRKSRRASGVGGGFYHSHIAVPRERRHEYVVARDFTPHTRACTLRPRSIGTRRLQRAAR